MKKLFKKNKLVIYMILLVTITGFTNCKKWIQVDPPITNINSGNVFSNPKTASAVLTDIYANMSVDNQGFTTPALGAITFSTALSSDELTLVNPENSAFSSYFKNSLMSEGQNRGDYWPKIYSVIFVTNAAIEGLSKSALTSPIKRQLLGEAKFMRAFCYFYLTNLYKEVPLVISTDPAVNVILSKSPVDFIYKQILSDLKESQDLLSEKYLSANLIDQTLNRVRPTKWAATALLARVYLYQKNYESAESEATKLINNNNIFSLTSLNDTFLANSSETIWALQPVGVDRDSNTGEGKYFNLNIDGGGGAGPTDAGHPVFLKKELYDAFDNTDLRKSQWIGTYTDPNTAKTYHYPNKYKIGFENVPTQEFSIVFRLAEQYLIRAEARVELGKLPGATSDLFAIRERAGQPAVSNANREKLLDIILKERQLELFTEWGHRWFDLKRTGKLDAVMAIQNLNKGGTGWKPHQTFYPVPFSEIQRAPNIKQNDGY